MKDRSSPDVYVHFGRAIIALNRMSANGLSSRIQQFLNPVELQRVGVQSPFQRLALQMQDVSGDRGVLKEVIQNGEGQLIPMDASVLIHFSGYLEYSDRPFESNNRSKHPPMMKLGRDVTLPGLELGLLTMKKGEFSRFLFLAKYAYGEMGCPPLIPPSATVLYEVQVLDFLDSAEADEFFALTPEQQNTAALSTMLKVANTELGFGNRCFNQKRYGDAKERYKKALTLLLNRKAADQGERNSIAAMKLPTFLNLSLALLRLERPVKALRYGQKALDVEPHNAKGLFRCGQACLEMRDYEKAQDFLLMAQAQKPFNNDINNLLKKLAACLKDSADKEKEMCTRMFANFNAISKK
ncbi:inactive peptidyl-prolyl cis-trans isomerase FKBP6 isoform X2 [Paramormyrops kingsleyae]|uniref:peptidylprolyl isomerase n=1 Tax=Paramormyrops kingsleyae TaxID=1676925 RepID=A0A3B3T334_9TELE|nr:inactive peptidyl-prolyl cis-trans isomerase FKBP6 [Paramormyrops kingsleyae]